MKRLAFLFVMLAPLTASAFEHQHRIGVDGGVAFISIDQKPTLSVGGGGGVHYAYGLIPTAGDGARLSVLFDGFVA